MGGGVCRFTSTCRLFSLTDVAEVVRHVGGYAPPRRAMGVVCMHE